MNPEAAPYLPLSFQHQATADEGTFRVNLDTCDDVETWLQEYGKQTYTSWKVLRSNKNSKRLMNRKKLFCDFKSSGCTATIDIKIKIQTQHNIRHDKYLKDGLKGIVKITGIHNHPLNKNQIKNFSYTKIHKIFIEYFKSGLGTSKAIKAYEDSFKDSHGLIDTSDRTIFPIPATVNSWLQRWRKRSRGPHIQKEDLTKLVLQRQHLYETKNCITKINKNPFVILVITEIMQKAHQLPFSKCIVFIDSKRNCDAANNYFTTLMTPSSAGAMPLGVIVTKRNNEEAYTTGFKMLQNALPESFGGQGYPLFFMTDDNNIEQRALQNVWPLSGKLLFHVDIGLSVWRWLKNPINRIEKDHRNILYKLFQKIMLAPTQAEATQNFHLCAYRHSEFGINENYINWKAYIEKYWNRHPEWCIAWRNTDIHNHDTYIFCEFGIKLLKINYSKGIKLFSMVDIVDKICSKKYEHIYRNRILEFLKNKPNRWNRSFYNIVNQYKGTKKKIVELGDDLYSVPSDAKDKRNYTVDVKIGTCECVWGNMKKLCKHQAAVMNFFNINPPNAPVLDESTRHEVNSLLIEKNIHKLDHFNITIEEDNFTDSSTSVQQEDNISEDIEAADKDNSTVISYLYEDNFIFVTTEDEIPSLSTVNVPLH